MKKKIIVVGGGAAGLMAAGRAAERGHEVHLYEKNNRIGKKILITGKGRCNVTRQRCGGASGKYPRQSLFFIQRLLPAGQLRLAGIF